jgi:hypothetical protein
MNERQAVAYTGADEQELGLYRGHPGRIIDAAPGMNEITVSFVNGPSLSLAPTQVEVIADDEYRARGERLVRLLHPLDERGVPRFNAVGSEWPD